MIACTSEIDPAELYEHGLKDVLRKPVTMASLRHMLHKWMPRRNASTFKLQSHPTPLGRGIKSGSGIFTARILMVEDCEVTAMATQCMFQEMGLWIDSVVDGEAGMRTLSGAATYDLILLDVNLPNMSGYALCSWYKEHCRTHDMRPATVVAVTSDPDREVCFEFGFDHVLPKPLTAVACYKVLRRWLDVRANRILSAPSKEAEGTDDFACGVGRLGESFCDIDSVGDLCDGAWRADYSSISPSPSCHDAAESTTCISARVSSRAERTSRSIDVLGGKEVGSRTAGHGTNAGREVGGAKGQRGPSVESRDRSLS